MPDVRKDENERYKAVFSDQKLDMPLDDLAALADYANTIWDWQAKDFTRRMQLGYIPCYLISIFIVLIVFGVIMGVTGNNVTLAFLVGGVAAYFSMNKIPAYMLEPNVRKWAHEHVFRLQQAFPELSYAQATAIIPRFYMYRAGNIEIGRRSAYYPFSDKELMTQCVVLTYEAIKEADK